MPQRQLRRQRRVISLPPDEFNFPARYYFCDFVLAVDRRDQHHWRAFIQLPQELEQGRAAYEFIVKHDDPRARLREILDKIDKVVGDGDLSGPVSRLNLPTDLLRHNTIRGST